MVSLIIVLALLLNHRRKSSQHGSYSGPVRKNMMLVYTQGMHVRYSIVNHFMDQENLQIYAQMYGILTALSLKYHTQYSLKNGGIHLVILIVW